MMQKTYKKTESWHMGTHMRVLSESFPINTNMTGFRWFSKFFASLYLGQKKPQHWTGYGVHGSNIASNALLKLEGIP